MHDSYDDDSLGAFSKQHTERKSPYETPPDIRIDDGIEPRIDRDRLTASWIAAKNLRPKLGCWDS